MKKILYAALLILGGCVSLSYSEKETLLSLAEEGISADVSQNGWERPANPFLAATLNILPGLGNFYLGSGDAAAPLQWVYGGANFLFWPLAIVWSVP